MDITAVQERKLRKKLFAVWRTRVKSTMHLVQEIIPETSFPCTLVTSNRSDWCIPDASLETGNLRLPFSRWNNPELRTHQSLNREPEILKLTEVIKSKDQIIADLQTKLGALRVCLSSRYLFMLQGVVREMESRISTRLGISARPSDGAHGRNTSRLRQLRDRFKSSKSKENLKTPRATTARARTPAPSSRTWKSQDEIDQVVQSYLAETDQIGRLRRVSYGIYLLGCKKIGVSVKNGKPLVRIGGGASVHLDVYLVTHS